MLDLSVMVWLFTLSGDAFIKSICSPSGIWVSFISSLSTKKYSGLIAGILIPSYFNWVSI